MASTTNRRSLLELRTDIGRVYVCTSGWQRLYLLWTFRHFHLLSERILNRRQRQLIQDLSNSAVVTPAEPVPAGCLIGAVEHIRLLPQVTPSEAPAPGEVWTEVQHDACEMEVGVAKPRNRFFVWRRPDHAGAPATPPSAYSEPAAARSFLDAPGPRSAGSPLHVAAPRQQRRFWVAVAVTMATLLAAVMFFARRIKTATDGRAGAAFRASPSPRSSVRVPLEVSVVSVARLPYVQSPHAIGSPFASATRAPALRGVTVNPDSVPSADSRRQLAEPPESFLYPVAPNPNLVGSVMLKAVIGADGAVKQVEVLSGNRALALAAVRAVRTWRYNPYLVQGRPVEAETNVTISFQGDDAVSVILPHR